MFCKFCGNQIDDDALFCAKCGRQVDLQASVSSKQVIATPTTAQVESASNHDVQPQSKNGDFDFQSWITENGLESYENALRSQDCDTEEVLVSLNEEDLERIGINIGGRRKIMNAIKRLDTSQETPQASEQKASVKQPVQNDDKQNDMTNSQNVQENVSSSQVSTKSRKAAAFLAFFLGWLGIHNFYIGRTKKGVGQLLLGILYFVLYGITISLPSSSFDIRRLSAIVGAIVGMTLTTWVLIDFIYIVTRRFWDSNDKLIINLNSYHKSAVHTIRENIALSPKNRKVTALLAIFLGGMGIHSFYTGRIKRGVLQFMNGIFYYPVLSFLLTAPLQFYQEFPNNSFYYIFNYAPEYSIFNCFLPYRIYLLIHQIAVGDFYDVIMVIGNMIVVIWALVDFINILRKRFKDGDGKLIIN